MINKPFIYYNPVLGRETFNPDFMPVNSFDGNIPKWYLREQYEKMMNGIQKEINKPLIDRTILPESLNNSLNSNFPPVNLDFLKPQTALKRRNSWDLSGKID